MQGRKRMPPDNQSIKQTNQPTTQMGRRTDTGPDAVHKVGRAKEADGARVTPRHHHAHANVCETVATS